MSIYQEFDNYRRWTIERFEPIVKFMATDSRAKLFLDTYMSSLTYKTYQYGLKINTVVVRSNSVPDLINYIGTILIKEGVITYDDLYQDNLGYAQLLIIGTADVLFFNKNLKHIIDSQPKGDTFSLNSSMITLYMFERICYHFNIKNIFDKHMQGIGAVTYSISCKKGDLPID